MEKKVRTFSVKAQGDSMFPILQNNDTVEYKNTSFKNIKVNDIVLIYQDDIMMTHRVIYKRGLNCITRGDNNSAADAIVHKEKVLAKAVRFKRRGVWHNIQDVYVIQSALYLNEIQRLEHLLNSQKILHVFLKGVLVSLRYEGIIPKRIYADCDILVQRSDYLKMRKTFSSLGYQLIGKVQSHTNHKNRENKPEESYIKVIHGTPVIFDIHFEPVFLMTQLGGMDYLYPPKLLSKLRELILERRESKIIKGYKYSLCSVSDQILYLALHIFHHNFTGINRYDLLHAVISKSASNKVWKEVQDTILEYHLEGYLFIVFYYLKKYFKTSIPEFFTSAIQPSSFKKQIGIYIINRVDIFSKKNQIKAGLERFILILILSPQPLLKKLLLLFHKDVIQFALTIASINIKSFVRETCTNSWQKLFLKKNSITITD